MINFLLSEDSPLEVYCLIPRILFLNFRLPFSIPKPSQTFETKHFASPIINKMFKLQGDTGQKWTFQISYNRCGNFTDYSQVLSPMKNNKDDNSKKLYITYTKFNLVIYPCED
ncbi:MAG: hypothetical protein XD43_1109 [Thermococcales archaeon 44_46]|nr:MAG: hypothetical protein XD43_1109 [Thermococcales archaeon 44_46]